MKRVGIYSGTFNPVHAGHISFALQALDEAKLDRIYIMPERHRKGLSDVAHYGHRVAMIRQAIKPHRRLKLMETTEISFSVDKTFTNLRRRFQHDELVFLIGSDNLKQLPNWPGAKKLLSDSELVIGIREGDESIIQLLLDQLPVQPKKLYLIDSYAGNVSSSKIREALRRQQHTEGILASVRRYSDRNWLYVSLGALD